MVEKGLDSRWCEVFFRKLRVGNEGITIQRHVNSRGYFLHLAEFRNGRRRRSSLIVPEGSKGSGWKEFDYHLAKVASFKDPMVVNTNRAQTEGDFRRGVETSSGMEAGRFFYSKGTNYASILRSPAWSSSFMVANRNWLKGKELGDEGDNGCRPAPPVANCCLA